MLETGEFIIPGSGSGSSVEPSEEEQRQHLISLEHVLSGGLDLEDFTELVGDEEAGLQMLSRLEPNEVFDVFEVEGVGTIDYLSFLCAMADLGDHRNTDMGELYYLIFDVLGGDDVAPGIRRKDVLRVIIQFIGQVSLSIRCSDLYLFTMRACTRITNTRYCL